MSTDQSISDGVCVVTQPLAGASESATESLLAVLSAITTVSLLTANLSAESKLRDNHEVVEISNEGTGNSIPTAAVRFLRNQLLLCSALRRREEHLVLFFGTTSYLLPILYSQLLGKTVILEPRGNVPESLRVEWGRAIPNPFARALAGVVWILEQIGYLLADAIITLSPSMAADLNLNRFEEKLYPNGAWYVDLDRFECTTPHAQRDRTVGYLGRLGEEKGIDGLIEIVGEIPPEITFVFVGDGDKREYIETELAEKIESGTVEITGWVDHEEVPAYLNDFRLLVLPSKTEGLPVTILESLACGTPVYARPVGGVPDVLVDGETGFLMMERDPTSVARRIETILHRDDIDQITNNAQELVEQEYSFDAAVDRYRTIFFSIKG